MEVEQHPMNPVPPEVHPADTDLSAPVQETARVVQARSRAP